MNSSTDITINLEFKSFIIKVLIVKAYLLLHLNNLTLKYSRGKKIITTYSWAKKATAGNLRSWVSTNTFCTKTLGSQLCYKKKKKKISFTKYFIERYSFWFFLPLRSVLQKKIETKHLLIISLILPAKIFQLGEFFFLN